MSREAGGWAARAASAALASAAAEVRAARARDEAGRVAQVKARGAVPQGVDAPQAPARGALRVSEAWVMLPGGTRRRDGVTARDVTVVEAMNRRGVVFTPGQVAMARLYADLVQRREGSGMRCASVEASTGGGGGGGRMDAFVRDGETLAKIRARIGEGVALAVRRLRPSARGPGARVVTDRALVDGVCIEGKTVTAILVAHGWSVTGGARGMARRAMVAALQAALDRMQGYRD